MLNVNELAIQWAMPKTRWGSAGSRFVRLGFRARRQALGVFGPEANLRILLLYRNANPPRSEPQTDSRLACQPAQKFPLIHAVLEGFVPVDEHDWDFVIKLPPQLSVAIYIHFPPRESAAARQLGETLF